MNPEDFFSTDYAQARQKFLAGVADHGARSTTYHNDAVSGPGGERLCCDVARFGPTDASSVLLIVSGTHGAETFCGSGAQVGLLRDGLPADLPADVAVVLVHAINPHGFAHLRRVTEDNVDLNRNFVDFSASLPEAPAYAELHAMLLPTDWEGPAREAAERGIAAYIEKNGKPAFQAAVSAGQYVYPDGLFYGGRAPTWSNRTWRQILHAEAGAARNIGLIDFHTGLGPYGYGEPIYLGDQVGYERARAWYGEDVTWPEQGTSTSAVVTGVLGNAVNQEVPGAAATCIGLEFGTLPLDDVFRALRGDHWLHLHGDPNSVQGKQIKADMRAAFYGDEPHWKRDVWERSRALVGQAIARISV
ncbi:MAG: M14 family metallopeptidase [Alphaproteobacteria bacterium]|nr:M14 family metallopeptidase [Alphaproteobacteria bacterium]